MVASTRSPANAELCRDRRKAKETRPVSQEVAEVNWKTISYLYVVESMADPGAWVDINKLSWTGKRVQNAMGGVVLVEGRCKQSTRDGGM